ncbi:MAG: hypothetical protein J1E37_06090 [Prevotella sp.]|nr:hypothetical protein [Prevotella sp.]
MGEIAIPRREFLYDLQFWEVRRIIRGYRRRDVLKYQLLRLCAYMSCFSMRPNKSGQSPAEWLPMDFDRWKEADRDDSPITEDDERELTALMESLNKR